MSIDEFKEERLAEKLKLTSLETMSKIDSLRDEIEFLKEQQPEEHIKDEIELLENELTGSFSNLDGKYPEFHFRRLKGALAWKCDMLSFIFKPSKLKLVFSEHF